MGLKTKTNAIRNAKIPWMAIILESGFVVLGIVAALLVNNWWQAKSDQKRADAAMDAVVQELSSNRDAVRESIDYHAKVLAGLRAFEHEREGRGGEGEPEAPSIELFDKGFIFPPETPSHAWDASTYSGTLELIPFDRIVKASQLYQNQERYQQSATQISAEIYRRFFDGGPQNLLQNWKNLGSVISSVIYRECELARDYERVLPQLDPEVEPKPEPEYCSYVPGR